MKKILYIFLFLMIWLNLPIYAQHPYAAGSPTRSIATPGSLFADFWFPYTTGGIVHVEIDSLDTLRVHDIFMLEKKNILDIISDTANAVAQAAEDSSWDEATIGDTLYILTSTGDLFKLFMSTRTRLTLSVNNESGGDSISVLDIDKLIANDEAVVMDTLQFGLTGFDVQFASIYRSSRGGLRYQAKNNSGGDTSSSFQVHKVVLLADTLVFNGDTTAGTVQELLFVTRTGGDTILYFKHGTTTYNLLAGADSAWVMIAIDSILLGGTSIDEIILDSIRSNIAFGVPSQDSLQFYLPLDRNAFDHSGNGNHGTVTNAVLNTDTSLYGPASYRFDGTDSINVKYNTDFKSNSFTYYCGFYPTAEQTAATGLVETNAAVNGFAVHCNPGQPGALRFYAGALTATTDSVYNLNEWTYLMVVHDSAATADNVIVYVNGINVKATTGTAAEIASTNDIVIGARPADGQGFVGFIDESGYDTRAFSPAEALLAYQNSGIINLQANAGGVNNITLFPEYPNSAWDSVGKFTDTLSITSTIAEFQDTLGGSYRETFYVCSTSTHGSAQQNTMNIMFEIPDDFYAWDNDSAIVMRYKMKYGTVDSNYMDWEMAINGRFGSLLDIGNFASSVAKADSFQHKVLTSSQTVSTIGTPNPGDIFIHKIDVGVWGHTAEVWLGYIRHRYYSK